MPSLGLLKYTSPKRALEGQDRDCPRRGRQSVMSESPVIREGYELSKRGTMSGWLQNKEFDRVERARPGLRPLEE